jgi:glycosyltransferase involved in cell wall biosynthesis
MMFSICITVKNRSRIQYAEHELLLLPNCVKSIRDAVGDGLACELVVVDWESDDWPLNEWLETAAAPIPVNIVAGEGTFSRGAGRNLAAKSAKGDILFFLDADSLINESVIHDGIKHVQEGKSYFPIIYSFDDPEHKTGRWRPSGYGNCMVTRHVYDSLKGWPEYVSWGSEDKCFFEQTSSVQPVIREQVPGFYHQWHPNDMQWKDRYSEETRKATMAIKELTDLIPAGSTVILVDQEELHRHPLVDRRCVPFIERDGEYWGPPPDDETAIREMDRMQNQGAQFIVFAWMAFWWLEHYSDFHQYLRRQFSVSIDNQRLVVFDLRARPTPTSQPRFCGT